MKKLMYLLLIPILLFTNGSCENESNESADQGPLISEEAIFDEIAKDYEGLDKNDLCIVEVEEFGKFFVAGFFAYDRGCAVEKLYFNGYEIKSDHSEVQKVMLANNFKNNAEDLVQQFHIKVINCFKSIVWDFNDDFEGNSTPFEKPKTYIEDGMVVSQLWVQRPAGMIKERSYYLSTLKFDKDGNFVDLKASNKFSVQY